MKTYEGPVLVLAGAGSGKTRVITYRIAYLLQNRLAKPWEILAMTFTNKAANEMKERVNSLLGGSHRELFIGTFHSFGAQFLRQHGDAFGRNSRFTIYDEEDQKRLIRTLLKQNVSDEEVKTYQQIGKRFIEKIKGNLLTAEAAALNLEEPKRSVLLRLFQVYEKTLQENNAFDFDDLVALPCHLLRKDRNLLSRYRDRFRFLLIDEFQDTNLPQGELARLLAAPSGNITAVGDDDQSIYGWRGAHIGNILQFEQDYKNVHTFRLEQNYRSTQSILDTAHQVIQCNLSRHPKKLWTSRKGGEKPRLISLTDDREEAQTVVARIQEILKEGRYNPGDIAIFYRTNAQSRLLEDALRQNVLPYVIVGGLRFYERKEIKDFLAYLRLLVNPNDILSLQRIINLPPRGIGERTIQRLNAYAAAQEIPLFQAVLKADAIEELGKRSSHKLKEFGTWIKAVRKISEEKSLFEVGERLLHGSGLLDYYRKEDAADYKTREENLSELLNALREYCFESGRTGIEDLESFLQEVALVTDIDRWNADEKAVTLMTLHAAKGLEFPVVFMTGLEDGLFPLQNTLDEPLDVEEERRLFYVGATRAKDLLFFTYARSRLRWGQEMSWQSPSRFLKEIPDSYIDREAEKLVFDFSDDTDKSYRKLRSAVRRLNRHSSKTIPQRQDESFPLGSRVRHSQFGEGIVVRSDGEGEALRLLVNFEQNGEKLLLASYAKLQLIA